MAGSKVNAVRVGKPAVPKSMPNRKSTVIRSKKLDGTGGTTEKTKWVNRGTYGGTSTHVTKWNAIKNTRKSYDINPSPSGGWVIENLHSINQKYKKGDPRRKANVSKNKAVPRKVKK